MFADKISNIQILSIIELSWENVNKTAFPRPYHALSFRIKGNSEFVTKDNTIKVRSKEILYVPQNIGYHLSAKDEHLICIHFLADNFNEDKIEKFIFSNYVLFENMFTSMYNQWTQKKPGYYAIILSTFYKIISKIQMQQSHIKLTSFSDNLSNALQYIHEHFTESTLTIKKIAEVSSLSESHFRRVFKNCFGVSPLRYINDMRIDFALELLASNYYKIYEISEMVGFADAKYFSIFIKKETGHSPFDYKKELL